MRYTLRDIARISGNSFHGKDMTVTRVITDSRTLPVDGKELFVAIKTADRDGHLYIGELYARGVMSFVVQQGVDTTLYPEAGFIEAHESTVEVLQSLAAHHRRQFKGKVVGITGSYGKTIVKEWIAQLTPPGVKIFRSPKSYNSQTGVPLSVLMIEGSEDYAVIEAGISEPDEMATLWEIIHPNIGIVTSIGEAHIENFSSRSDLLAEKLKLFKGCSKILYPAHCSEIGDALKEKYPKSTVIDVAVNDSSETEDDFTLRNGALAAAFWVSEGYRITQSAIDNLQPVAMRLEVNEGLYDSVIVNDTYNSDINSLTIALDYLGRIAGKRLKTVIMADMAVTTGDEKEIYKRAGELIKNGGVDSFVGIGPLMRRHAGLFGKNSSFHSTVDDFLRSVTSAELRARTILIKGGSGARFDRISHALERKSHTTVMEVDLDAMIHNLRLYRSLLKPGVGIMPMIKASGYGHGTFEIANTLQQQGVEYLAVAFADEGVVLRESGITMPIVVLNAAADSFGLMIRHRLEPEIYNFASLNEFTEQLKRYGEQHYPVHIKIDTGMHRLGFGEKDIAELNAVLAKNERYIRVSTIFSHLAAADDPAHDDFTHSQIAGFEHASNMITDSLSYPVRRHIANTKGAERFPEAQYDMIRLGIGLYGIGMEGTHKVASLKTRIVSIAELSPEQSVGYGRKGTLCRVSKIATIPIGYADGLNRRLSCGKWSVLVNGKSAPIVGNICMDSCMIDITDINDVKEGDEAVVFCSTPGNSVIDMAQVLETIPYEVLTSISERVKRIYTKE